MVLLRWGKGGGGLREGSPDPLEKFMGRRRHPLNFKSQCNFQCNTTKKSINFRGVINSQNYNNISVNLSSMCSIHKNIIYIFHQYIIFYE